MAAELPRFSGAILAGGRSRRMGRDKALIEVGAGHLIGIAVGALADAGAAEIYVVGGDAHALGGLGLRCIPDQFPGEGPLGGIITALDAAREEVVAVLACDLLGTGGPAVRAIVASLGDHDVVIPVVEGRRQTLHAAWQRQVRGVLRDRFDAGARAVHEVLDQLAVLELVGGDPDRYRDADRPADLRAPPGTDAAGDTQ